MELYHHPDICRDEEKTGKDYTMKHLKFLTLIGLAVVTLGLGACNTVEGAGQDIENLGDSVEDAGE